MSADISALTDEIAKSPVAGDPYVTALVQDLTGQITESCSKGEYFNKWGRHYLPSLMGAHLFQQCNNFKDPGVQFYGGNLFSELRDQLDELFLKLPPPVPSNKPTTSSYGSSSSSSPASVSMSSYYNSSAPCFAGSCIVEMSDGTQKLVSDICKGDSVKTPSGISATITCVLKTICLSGTTSLVQLPGGLLVTPWHPVRVNSKWEFPANLGIASEQKCPAVYSFFDGRRARDGNKRNRVCGTGTRKGRRSGITRLFWNGKSGRGYEEHEGI